jgi:hypothetical protein
MLILGYKENNHNERELYFELRLESYYHFDGLTRALFLIMIYLLINK